MSRNERRTSPRKICTVPIRFHLSSNGRAKEGAADLVKPQNPEYIGKALNLSERGVYFMCRETLNVGQPIELYLTLPTELTGRAPENVRCKAHVVHVDESGSDGLRGIGACVEQFESAAALHDWTN